ncbi:MAG: hypothetical protein KC488_01555, partial [Candidatus Cloacimonetes bacterium]|nr:hypothetical protein [Candidatus Cloacimonadota bacterium]
FNACNRATKLAWPLPRFLSKVELLSLFLLQLVGLAETGSQYPPSRLPWVFAYFMPGFQARA